MAVMEDLPRLIDMAEKFHSVSPWSHLPFDAGRVQSTFEGAITSDAAAVFVTEDVEAMAGVMVSPIFFSPEKLAQELIWWSEKPGCGRALIKAITDWAKEQGAHSLSLARFSGISDDRMHAMYERMGFKQTEIFYIKAL